jgi:hypothetical protein
VAADPGRSDETRGRARSVHWGNVAFGTLATNVRSPPCQDRWEPERSALSRLSASRCRMSESCQDSHCPGRTSAPIGTGLRVLDIVSIHDCRRTNGER